MSFMDEKRTVLLALFIEVLVFMALTVYILGVQFLYRRIIIEKQATPKRYTHRLLTETRYYSIDSKIPQQLFPLSDRSRRGRLPPGGAGFESRRVRSIAIIGSSLANDLSHAPATE